jgi:hypothetical protein
MSKEESPYRDLIEKVAKKVVEWRLSVPAIVVLESAKPLSFVASQVMVFFEPIVQSLFNIKDYERFYEMLEDRRNLELLIQEIERQEDIRLESKKK